MRVDRIVLSYEKSLEEKLNRLRAFTEKKEQYLTKDEIVDWVSSCYELFTIVSVSEKIIENFITDTDLAVNKRTDGKMGIFTLLDNTIIWKKSDLPWFRTNLAFKVAENKIRELVAEKKIVPQWLLDTLKSNEKLALVYTLLLAVENAYENNDSKALTTASNTLLEQVLNYDEDLKEKDKIGKKIQALVDNDKKRKKFGATKDLVCGLNNSKVIRNESVVHPKTDKIYNTPLLIATSYAYLVVMFLILSLNSGVISA